MDAWLIIFPIIMWGFVLAAYFFYLNLRKKSSERISEAGEVLMIKEKDSFVGRLGELVVSMTPRPFMVGKFLPAREASMTDEECYEYFHNQFLPLQETSFSVNLIKSRHSFSFKVRIALFYVLCGIVTLLPIILGKHVVFFLFSFSLPMIVLAVIERMITSSMIDYQEKKMQLFYTIDDKFSDLIAKEE